MIESRLKKSAKKMSAPPRSEMARFVDRADEEDLIAVAYATVDSPFGTWVAAATDSGLVRLALSPYRTEDVLEELATRLSPRVLEQPSKLDPVRRELDEYFAGRRIRVRPCGRLVAGYRVQRARVASDGPDPLRLDHELRDGCARGGQPARSPGCRQRAPQQPGSHRDPVPPGDRFRRWVGGLRRGTADEGSLAADGGRALAQ